MIDTYQIRYEVKNGGDDGDGNGDGDDEFNVIAEAQTDVEVLIIRFYPNLV